MERAVLSVCNRIKRRIKELEWRVRQWREMVTSINREMEGMPRVQRTESKIEWLMASIVDGEKAIVELKGIWFECIMEMSELIELVIKDKVQGVIMLRRYGYCERYEVISRKVGYSLSQVYRKHRQGMRQWTQNDSKMIVA